MRPAAAILLSATCLFADIDCYSQDTCSARSVTITPGEKPPTIAELAHRAFVTTPPEVRRRLAPGDVELILRCGTQEDAEELFAALQNTSLDAPGFTVVEADQDVIRVSWDDGFKPNLAAFRFHFDPPLNAIPQSGEKVRISGTYSSYSREPFQINMANSSFVILAPAH